LRLSSHKRFVVSGNEQRAHTKDHYCKTDHHNPSVNGRQQHSHPLDELEPCAAVGDVLTLRRAAEAVRISAELRRYVVDLVGATRTAAGVQLGASPRASIALMKAAQALALFDELEFVTPDQIQELAVPVIAHRLIMEPQARFSGRTPRTVIQEVLKKVKVPA